MKRIIFLIAAVCAYVCGDAQIGYQVSLLNNATGQPRANESVSVKVQITDSKGNVICSETKNETTNDFGVLSMSVGTGDTFANANWDNLPFFISAEVDGVLIGKSQILSVPVAEHAMHTGTLTKEILRSKSWSDGYNDVYSFSQTGFTRTITYSDGSRDFMSGSYYISGDVVFLDMGRHEEGYFGCMYIYLPEKNRLFSADDSHYLR